MKGSMPLVDAERWAAVVAQALGPACGRIVAAGSIRRKRLTVGDIEVVCEPRPALVGDLFGGEAAVEQPLAEYLPGLGRVVKAGPRYAQVELAGGPMLDLFMTTTERWGVILAIRTGSADFSRWLVTERRKGGALRRGLSVRDGRLWGPCGAVETVSETAFFEAIGVPWIPPELRERGRWGMR